MRPFVLVRESVATAMANKVPSALIAFLVAAMIATTLATVGRTAAAEEQLEQRMDAAGSRLLTIRDLKDQSLISSAVVELTDGLSVAERAVGILSAVDVVNGAVGDGAERLPAWGVLGEVGSVVTLTAGRWPGPGEALISTEAVASLGMKSPYGWLTEATGPAPMELGVVGSFTPRPPFEEYAAGVVYVTSESRADSLWVVLRTASQVGSAQQAVLGIVAPPRFDDVQITSPETMAELRTQVLGDLGAYGRTLLVGVMSAGALLTSVVVLADVLVRRRDLGRRRALGASRTVILWLVTARTLVPVMAGAAVGVAVGIWMVHRLGSRLPPAAFTGGVATLAVLTGILSALPPALYAATRDPVRVLRTA